MEFRNLTPFDALMYGALDPDDREHNVVAMKVGYRLVARPDGAGVFDAVVIDDEPLALCAADEFHGEEGASSVREESDLAPYKPRCDVIVRGSAHAPEGTPARRWDVRIRIRQPRDVPAPEIERPQPLNPRMALMPHQQSAWEHAREDAAQRVADAPRQQVVLDKSLTVTGPRTFRRDALSLLRAWRLTGAEPATQVPLRWEYAFGGASRLPNPGSKDDPGAPEWLLDEVCYSNPLGRGWIEFRQEALAYKARQERPRALPGPQIEPTDAPIRKLLIARHPKGEVDARKMAEVVHGYGATPAGFGFTGRAWAPRLALAGTYDQAWLDERWPGLPDDIDFAYWNGAPADQQIPYPRPGLQIELWNLTDPALTPGGRLSVQLPAHRPFLLLRMTGGAFVPLPLLTDTLVIDTDAMTVSMTHRFTVPAGTPARVVEARFETDPSAPLLKRPTDTALEGAD